MLTLYKKKKYGWKKKKYKTAAYHLPRKKGKGKANKEEAVEVYLMAFYFLDDTVDLVACDKYSKYN